MEGATRDMANNDSTPDNSNANSNAATTPYDLNNIKITEVKAGLDNKRCNGIPKVKWDNISVDVIHPSFSAAANVKCNNLGAGQKVEIGWILATKEHFFVQEHNRFGVLSVEYPDLVQGNLKLINNGNGASRDLPYCKGGYMNLRSHIKIDGSNKNSTECYLAMQHQPRYSAPMKIARTVDQVEFFQSNNDAYLTGVHRKEVFYSMLIAKDQCQGKTKILKAFEWQAEANLDVDFRAGVVAITDVSKTTTPKEIKADDVQIPPEFFGDVTCESNKAIIWRYGYLEKNALKDSGKYIVPCQSPMMSKINFADYLEKQKLYCPVYVQSSALHRHLGDFSHKPKIIKANEATEE